nr:cationic amino acid transporter 4-like [Equus caballus]
MLPCELLPTLLAGPDSASSSPPARQWFQAGVPKAGSEQGLKAGQHSAGQPVTPSGPRRCQQLAWCSSQLPTMAHELSSTTSLSHFCQKLNRLKTLEESTTERSLRHHLTMLDLILLGMGTTGSVGLYVLVGTVAKEMAGPAVLVSFGVAAVASLLGALCYAEFGVRVPGRGSAYLFTYVSMGELWAFLVGWNTILGYLIGVAAVARVWSSYVDAIFSHRIRSFTMAHVGSWQVLFLAQYPDFLAAGVILLASALVSYGVGVSSWLNRTFSAINLVVILFIIILGFMLARPHNWSAEEGGFAPFGFSGIIDGAATCFIAFQGFGAIAASSMEAQNPKRAVPIAIAISLGLAAGTNILVSAALTFMVPWRSLDPDLALTDAFNQRGYSWAGFIVAAGAICGKRPFWARREGTGWWGPALSLPGNTAPSGPVFPVASWAQKGAND